MCSTKKRCKKCSLHQQNNATTMRQQRNKRHRTVRRRRRRQQRQKGAGIGSTFGKFKNRITNRVHNRIRKNALKKTEPGSKKGFDLHGKTLGAVQKVFGNRGMVLPGYKYAGPGNNLAKQLVHRNGKIVKYLQRPTNKLDQIASKHDVCYELGKKSKTKCDYEMLKDIKRNKVKIPPVAGAFVKSIIGAKAFLDI